jgi:hypothetical protein
MVHVSTPYDKAILDELVKLNKNIDGLRKTVNEMAKILKAINNKTMSPAEPGDYG